MFSQELSAIKHSNLYRERKIYDNSLSDFASNDYLGLSQKKKLFKKAFLLLKKQTYHAPRASLMVNGYNTLHQKLEKKLCKLNGFENGVVLGSGFLANIALFDTLVRKNDKIFIDEKYHASGIFASKNLTDRAIFFKHNDPNDLLDKLKNPPKGRILIAIEGVYSMDGDIACKEFAKIALDKNALLVVDEAHSSGCIGENLLGYFDYYKIPIHSNFIKMGTLSKAYGSYGAYILGSKNVIDFLCNRGKSIIYTTALSLFDVALALINLKYIQKHKEDIHKKISLMKNNVFKHLRILPQTQILVIPFDNTQNMQKIHLKLQENKILTGGIRKPTVEKPILRITLSIKNSTKEVEKMCKIIKKFQG